jgi:hypothetical protein
MVSKHLRCFIGVWCFIGMVYLVTARVSADGSVGVDAVGSKIPLLIQLC